MTSGGEAAVGCLSAALGLAGAAMIVFGPVWGEYYWWLKGPALVAAAFGLPFLLGRLDDDG